MKVYAAPAEIPVPGFEEALINGRYDVETEDRLHEQYREDVRRWLRDHGYTIVGNPIYFGVADGAAEYLVAKAPTVGTVLIHIPLGDNWSLPDAHVRGLRVADVVKMAKAPPLFGVRA